MGADGGEYVKEHEMERKKTQRKIKERVVLTRSRSGKDGKAEKNMQ